jgi:DNA-binding NarL/FixJ family response regulator
VDDHPRVREELRALLEAEPNLEVCGEAGDSQTALLLIETGKPDLLILDIMLGKADGLSILESLGTRLQNLRVLVLSMNDQRPYVERAFRLGASGYLTKAEAPATIALAVGEVLAGRFYLSDHMAARLGGTVSSLRNAGSFTTNDTK